MTQRNQAPRPFRWTFAGYPLQSGESHGQSGEKSSHRHGGTEPPEASQNPSRP
jgi:hypothetical protein